MLDDAGWTARAVPVQGTEALSAALQRRGWDAVLYGGDGPLAVPSRKALEMVRLADPHLPFLAVSPRMRPGELSAILRGLPSRRADACPDVAQLPAVLTRELEQARMRRRVGGAHRLLGAQQAIADHLAAGLEPARCATACWRRSASRSAGPSAPSGARTARSCAARRSGPAPGARTPVAELAAATHEQTYAAGQGLAGRVWAFRRPVWLADLPGEAVRAGLVTAAAFPIALGDECVGVIELYAPDAREPNAEVSALFATVGGQLAAYFARRRVRARARRSFDGARRWSSRSTPTAAWRSPTAPPAPRSASTRTTSSAATGSPSPSREPAPRRRPRPPTPPCWPARTRRSRPRRHRLALVPRPSDADGDGLGALALGRAAPRAGSTAL